MKAEIWELQLAYSPYDLLFNNKTSIRELYIPALNYSFNFSFDEVNVIKYNENRYKPSSYYYYQNVRPILIKTIDLDGEQIKLYRHAIKYQK
jgi:hypothetical protein